MIVGFGNVSDGQLAVSGVDSDHVLSPTVVSSADQLASNVVQISCGAYHSLFLLDDGSVYSCGNNDAGQLGHDGPRRKLGQVSSLSAYKILQVSCGGSYSLALSKEGYIFSWGSNQYNQLGVGMKIEYSFSVKRIALSSAVQISSGADHSLALLSDGRLYSWGRNDDYQCGLGHDKTVDLPTEIKSLYGVPIGQITCGAYHSVALSVSGTVFMWGQNKCGQLGLGHTDNGPYPAQVKSLRSALVTKIVCGDYHTAALTKDGRLFTFGAWAYGQLGQSSKRNETTPRQVFELAGMSIKSVACGRCHTLALVGNKLYAFGLNGSGQLGINSTQSRFVPTLVQSDYNFQEVYAGGDHSFAICSPNNTPVNVEDYSIDEVLNQRCIAHLTVPRIRHILLKSVPIVVAELTLVLSNSPCVNSSFLKEEFKKYYTNRKNSGVNMDDVMTVFELLSECPHSETFKQTMLDSLERRLLPNDISLPLPDVEALRMFIILPWCPAFLQSERYKTLHVPFARALLALNKLPLEVIESWWSSFELRHFNRVLKVFKQVVAHLLVSDQAKNEEPTTELMLNVLKRLNKVNATTKKLSFDSFYVNELNDKVDVRQDYCQFVLKPDKSRFSFCNYPFIFNSAVKTMLLEVDASITQQILVQRAEMQNMQSLFLPFRSQVNPFLVLTVSRTNVVQDTITQLSSMSSNDLKKPLKVVFRGEEADDAGGVRKEFFLILFIELLQPKYGMFVENAESRKLWFAPTVFEGDVEIFQLIGVLCGLAIYNTTIIALPFPLALYKKLLDEPVILEDLKELSPVEGRSLESLLDYEDDDFEDIFSLVFQISVEVFETSKLVDLKPDGHSIPVTKANRHEYIDLYVDYKMNKSVEAQFDSFKTGFHKAVNSRMLHFFQPLELMEMVVGNEHYDWDEFEKSAEYRGDYWANHPTIRLFWKVFRSLPLDQKKKFLLFLTGSDRIPLLGMKQLKICIQPTSAGNEYYPVAHTCFNLLDLPRYTDENVLRKRLVEALEHTHGFTLV